MKPRFTIPRSLLDGAEAFVRVATLRSFRAAAQEMGISPSALSQRIKALEQQVGVALLTRTTRNVGLTQAGEAFLEGAQPALVRLSEAYEEARNFDQPAGLLRLRMPSEVVAVLILPILNGFTTAYPQIDLEVVTTEFAADLIEGGFDAGVQIGELLEADMIALRLTPRISFSVVGAPSYLERRGEPKRPADLRRHDCIRLDVSRERAGRWTFRRGDHGEEVPVTGRIATDDPALAIEAAKQGLGLVYLPSAWAQRHVAEGRLVAVLQAYMPTSNGAFLYYPSRAQALPKLRAFVSYVREHVGRMQSGSASEP